MDIAIVAVLVVLGQLEVWNGLGATHRQGPAWAQAGAYAIGPLFLLWRRARPVEAFVGLTAVAVVEFALAGSPEGMGVQLPATVAAYSVARWEQRHPPWWGLALVGVYGVSWVLLDPLSTTWGDRAGGLFWVSTVVISWFVGALVRSRVQNAEQRREARAARAEQAVAEERNRIARELHDVIGHSVSVMTVQAAAVRRRLAPEQIAEREALESVEAVGREALTEMRRMVGVLRGASGVPTREPPPTLADADRLADKIRAAGLAVHVSVTGTPRPLAPGLDLTAYRLLQEGLTNALRHADGPSRADVCIAYGPEMLQLAVRDDGRPVVGRHEPGHGLLGLRERVAAYGGELQARPRAGGGFELLVTLPLVLA